jgi:hypothetical protein
MQKIVIVNLQTLVAPAAVQNAMAGIQLGITRDFAPSPGGVDATIRYTTVANDIRPNEWPMFLVNSVANAPPAALAWHTATPQGWPYGIVPFEVDLADNADPFTSLDHEIKETLGDSSTNAGFLCVLNGQDAWAAAECADPVENDTYTVIPPNGHPVALSNFVFLPLWAEAGIPQGTKVDFMGTLTGPLQISPYGYYSFFQNGVWADHPAAREKHEFSRWARRRSKHLS